MEFPYYVAPDDTIEAPLERYIADLADHTYDQSLVSGARVEHDGAPRHVDRLRAISTRIGRACIDLLHHDPVQDQAADQSLLTAIRAGHGLSDSNVRKVSRQLPIVMTTAAIIRARTEPRRVNYLRQRLHQKITEELDTDYTETQAPDYDYRTNPTASTSHGAIVEFTATALLTRLAHPQLLAMPALPHQDYIVGGHGKGLGHDLIVVEADTKDNTAIHHVQIKANCLDLCKDKLGHEPEAFKAGVSRRAAGFYDRYHAGTVLVSACCDLQEEFVNRYSKSRRTTYTSPLTELLLKEARGKARDEDIDQLDTASNQLLLAITGDLRRRGNIVLQEDAHDEAC